MLTKTAPGRTAPTLTPRQRLNRGLAHTATGPVDLTRGAVGLGVHSARAGATQLRRRCRDSRAARGIAAAPKLSDIAELVAEEVAAARGAVSGLPAALQEARRSPGRRRRFQVAAGVAAVLLVAGAVVTVVVRRSGQPQQAPTRPPSVDVQPRP